MRFPSSSDVGEMCVPYPYIHNGPTKLQPTHFPIGLSSPTKPTLTAISTFTLDFESSVIRVSGRLDFSCNLSHPAHLVLGGNFG